MLQKPLQFAKPEGHISRWRGVYSTATITVSMFGSEKWVMCLGLLGPECPLPPGRRRRTPARADYLFGRTALANLAARRGNFERARQLLEPLLTRTRLDFGEFSALCMAQINLFLAEGKREPAQNWLDMWRHAIPDHPSLAVMERRLRSLPRAEADGG